MTGQHLGNRWTARWAPVRLAIVGIGAALAACSTVAPQTAAALPEIRLSERNRVPACVTPEKLMRFLGSGNRQIRSEYGDIARHYKEHGEKWRVRWDYAFYQMIIETNYLKFVNNAGQGDVKPRQYNFAGIGTTGGGVPGDTYPDVATGVLAQMQHLVVYSGERIDRPVAPRTREKQDEILAKTRVLGRAVTFQDLSGRWAVDRRYGTSIEFIATRFRAAHCNGRQDELDMIAEKPAQAAGTPVAAAEPDQPKARKGSRMSRAERARQAREQRNERTVAAASPARKPPLVDVEEETAEPAKEAPSGTDLANRAVAEGKARQDNSRAGLGAAAAGGVGATMLNAPKAGSCSVLTASYGGQKNVLIKVLRGAEVQYTALQVIDGQEDRLVQSFIRTHAAGGAAIGQFASREAALVKAFDLCPTAKAN